MSDRDELAEVAKDLARHARWARTRGETTVPAVALPKPAFPPPAAGPDQAPRVVPPPTPAPAARPPQGAPVPTDARPVGTSLPGRVAPPPPAFPPGASSPQEAAAPTGARRAAEASVGGSPVGTTASIPGRAAPPPPAPPPGASSPQGAPPPGARGPSAPAPPFGSPEEVDPAARLARIRAQMGDCTGCALGRGRKNLVFGAGHPRAELVFVGEGPGADEDEAGLPFVGKAGQLLTKMIEAMGYTRDSVYICNVVKCRPPGNRNPEPEEIAACEPFLQAQLAAIQPRAIVALGKFAAQTLLRDPSPITRLRGRWRSYAGIDLMPTFHPAYLLRNPAAKREAWNDLKAVLAKIGRKPPTRS